MSKDIVAFVIGIHDVKKGTSKAKKEQAGVKRTKLQHKYNTSTIQVRYK